MAVQNSRLKIAFCICGLATLYPQVTGAAALLLGAFLSIAFGNPFESRTKKWTTPLLQISVVGLGAGMNLDTVARVGLSGFVYTVVGIVLTLVFGLLLGRFLRVPKEVSILLTAGTAICGGSAIAAVASSIGAKNKNTSVALATIFFLNSVALLLFPPIGHLLGLDQIQFGLWSALAIHDTSSVVGASLQYGSEALAIATPVKLARALWIVPLTIFFGLIFKSSAKGAARKPWFILGFLMAAAITTYFPVLHEAGFLVSEIAKRILVLTLFLIGTALTKDTLTGVGVRPPLQAIILWITISVSTLAAILAGWIH